MERMCVTSATLLVFLYCNDVEKPTREHHEIIKVREGIRHVDLLTKVIPLKLFTDGRKCTQT